MRFDSYLIAFVITVALGLNISNSFAGAEREGTVQVVSFDLPLSDYLGAQSRAVLKQQAEDRVKFAARCPLKKKWSEITTKEDVLSFRQCLDNYGSPDLIARLQSQYKVIIRQETIGGVPTEIVTPVEGIAPHNRERVLINLHGGAFMWGGSRSGRVGQVESIPIAALGKIKIVSVDYRMAPEHQFPAASEDVAAVYEELLASYEPQNIGIYGCSAGGFLTAQSVAWILKQGLPTPGAIGIHCAGAASGSGDSTNLWTAIGSGGGKGGGGKDASVDASKRVKYLKNEDLSNPLAFPALDPQLMRRFPDTLLISSTRDFVMSSTVKTHAQLVGLGVKADLHIWEGLDHGFFYDPGFSESREVYDVIVRFFNEHLGQPLHAATSSKLDAQKDGIAGRN